MCFFKSGAEGGWEAAPPSFERQRTGALQNAIAINRAPFTPTGVADLRAGQRAAGSRPSQFRAGQ